ncbi:hypothetical protein FAI41_05290 [Acetobacteraceae bacterium]|nr:hypothetical protein FAI41_05290 [Acetobacteraceae bacterium]
MRKKIRRLSLRRRERHLRAVALQCGVAFSLLAVAFLDVAGKANAQTYSEGKNEEGRTSVLDRKGRSYNANGQSQPTERIHVKGVGTTPADLVSGSKANYLQKEVDLGALGKQSAVQAPFSTMTTTHDVIEDQQLRTIGQSLQYMPSVNLEGRGNGVFRLINRGYESDVEQNSRIDGLNAIITTPYATEQFDSVTVLNGAAASLFGPESPAGMMMMTQKRPTDKPFFNFNFGYDSNGAPLESLDTSLGKGPIKVRFNYLNQTGQLYTSNSNEWRNLYSGAIDLNVTKHTKLELNGSQYNSAVYGLPGTFAYNTGAVYTKGKNAAGNPNPAPGTPDAMGYLPDAPNVNLPSYGTNDTGMSASTSVGTMVLKHEFTKTLHLELGGLYEDASRNSLTAQNTLYNANGTFQCGGSSNCYQQNMVSSTAADDFRTWSNYAHLNWNMTDPIFHIRHKLNVGTTGYSLKNFNPIDAGIGMGGAGNISVGTGGLYDPSSGKNSAVIDSNGNAFGSGQVAPGLYWNNLDAKGKGQFQSALTQVQNVMFGDSFDIGDYFTIMGQMSWGWINTENYNKPGTRDKAGNLLGRVKQAGTSNGSFDPTVTFSFHPTKRFSAYFNWGQDTAPGTFLASGTNSLDQSLTQPARSTQYEGAIKYLWKDRFLVSLGGFGMSRPYVIGNSAAANKSGFLGNQNDMGMEFQVSGALTRELSMYGGVTYDNARYHCTDAAACALAYGGGKNPSGFYQNARVIGVAPWQSDFLLDWHPNWLHGVSFNSNIHYQGQRASNLGGDCNASGSCKQGQSYVSDYVTLDLGMRYVTHIADHMLVLRGNIDNVTNQKYWASMFDKNQTGATKGGFSAEVGAPQTWHITASYYF